MNKIQQAAQLLQQGKLKDAESIYRDLLADDPDNGMALWGMGRIAAAVQHYEAATDFFARAASSQPDQHLPLLDLATVLERSGRAGDAGAVYARALALAPADLQVRFLNARYLVASGDLERAEAALREILADEPTFAPGWFSLASLKTFREPDADMAAMAALLLRPAIKAGEKLQLHYALGKAHHECGDHDSAFTHFEEANRLDQERAAFRVEAMAPFFEQLRSVFSASYFDAHEQGSTGDVTPVFIVGQPRSGSTLLEQMLAGHPAVATAGEVSFLGDTLARGTKHLGGSDFPAGFASLEPDRFTDLGNNYLQHLSQAAPGANVIIDKLPANYQSIGAIRMILPQAKVLHLRRDPMDVCFSIYRHFFQASEPYFSTQQAIGAYHGYYATMMSHWDAVLPSFVHHLDYEDLVSQPEPVLRDVLAFCGLDWDSACLDFSAGQRHISTLSQAQVRGELNTGTGGAWEAYGDKLSPLISAIRGQT